MCTWCQFEPNNVCPECSSDHMHFYDRVRNYGHQIAPTCTRWRQVTRLSTHSDSCLLILIASFPMHQLHRYIERSTVQRSPHTSVTSHNPYIASLQSSSIRRIGTQASAAVFLYWVNVSVGSTWHFRSRRQTFVFCQHLYSTLTVCNASSQSKTI